VTAIPLEAFGSDGYAIFALIVVGGLAVVALVGLGGLALLVRGRGIGRLIGAGLVIGVLGLAILPWLSATIPARLQGARIEAASFWPETLDLTGRQVLVIRSSGDCSFCAPLVNKSGAAAVFVAQTDLADWTDEGRPGLTAWNLPPRNANRLVADPDEEPAFGYPDDPGVVWHSVPLPEQVDLVIVVDEQDFFVASQGAASGLSDEDAQDVRWSLHVYEVPSGRVEDLAEAVLLARMMQVHPDIPELFFPLSSQTDSLPPGVPYNAVLSQWVCGETAAPDCVRYFPDWW